MRSTLDSVQFGDEQSVGVRHELIVCPAYHKRWGTYSLNRIHGQIGELFNGIAASGPSLRRDLYSRLGKSNECGKLPRIQQDLSL
jgi:hypothetical protein